MWPYICQSEALDRNPQHFLVTVCTSTAYLQHLLFESRLWTPWCHFWSRCDKTRVPMSLLLFIQQTNHWSNQTMFEHLNEVTPKAEIKCPSSNTYLSKFSIVPISGSFTFERNINTKLIKPGEYNSEQVIGLWFFPSPVHWVPTVWKSRRWYKC